MHDSWSHILVLLLLACSIQLHAAAAQPYEADSGVVHLTDWPDRETRSTLRYDVLPFIDTLALEYRYDVSDDRPALRLRLRWTPGDSAVYRGVQTRWSHIPGNLYMSAIDLRADVVVDGAPRGALSIVVDSMEVGPSPDFVDISFPDLTWDNVFVDTSPELARAIFLNGFALTNLEIAGAAFTVLELEGPATIAGRRAAQHTRRVSIYRAPNLVDVFVDVSWLIGGRDDAPDDRAVSARGSMGHGSLSAEDRSRDRGAGARKDREGNEPGSVDDDGRRARSKGRSTTRGTEDRPVRGDESREGSEDRDRRRDEAGGDGGFHLPGLISDDDDDDDEDDELVPYALAAAGAAGILAIAGGTIGYYGSSRHTPLGITSGIVRRDGGLLLQAAVNEALLFDEPAPKRLTVKLLSFGNFLNSGLQPALGAGVIATSEGNGIEYEPTFSVGAVGLYRMLLLYGGYDVVHGGPELGVALNFRAFRWGARRESD